MAIHAHSTPASAFQPRLLRGGGVVPCRVLTSAEVVDLVETQGAVSVQAEPKCVAQALSPAEPDTAAQARALHSRRALVQAAEHGVALLAALGLPQLVRADIVTDTPTAIGDALDVVIAHLDALDAPAEDLEETGDAEPSLGWTPHIYQTALNIGDTADIELDMVDWEHSLGAPERHPYVFTMSSTHYEPANGSNRRVRNWESQASWAQGTRLEGEREAEPGYDLACDEDELDDDGLSRGEHDTADVEPSIGWPNDFLAQVSPGRSESVDLEEAAYV